MFEDGWENRQFLALSFCRGRREDFTLMNLPGALHIDGVRCTLTVGREVEMEIPDEPIDDKLRGNCASPGDYHQHHRPGRLISSGISD